MTFGIAVKQFSNLGKIIRFVDENGMMWDKAGEISNDLLKLLSNIPCETSIQGQNVIFELDLEKISSDSNVNIIHLSDYYLTSSNADIAASFVSSLRSIFKKNLAEGVMKSVPLLFFFVAVFSIIKLSFSASILIFRLLSCDFGFPNIFGFPTPTLVSDFLIPTAVLIFAVIVFVVCDELVEKWRKNKC